MLEERFIPSYEELREDQSVLLTAEQLAKNLNVPLPEGLVVNDPRPWKTHVSVGGSHRDSSNFEIAQYDAIYKLMNVDEVDDGSEFSRVFVAGFRHFAVGWIDEIFVQVYEEDGAYTPEFLRGCYIYEYAQNDILDEDAFFEMQLNDLQEFWDIPIEVLQEVWDNLEDNLGEIATADVEAAVETVIEDVANREIQHRENCEGQLNIGGTVIEFPRRPDRGQLEAIRHLSEVYQFTNPLDEWEDDRAAREQWL